MAIGFHLVCKLTIEQERLRKGTMYRAFVGYFQQALALFGCQLARQRDPALDAVALDAIDLDLVMRHFDIDTIQCESLALGVHAQGHRSTGAESGHDEIEGRWSAIVATKVGRFVGKQAVLAGNDLLLVSSLSVFPDDNRS
jgi:hypothetical protein